MSKPPNKMIPTQQQPPSEDDLVQLVLERLSRIEEKYNALCLDMESKLDQEGAQEAEVLEKAEAKGTSSGCKPYNTESRNFLAKLRGLKGLIKVLFSKLASLIEKLEFNLNSVNEPGVPTEEEEAESNKPQEDLCLEEHTEAHMGMLTSNSSHSDLIIPSNTFECLMNYAFNCDAGKGV
ncbi:uncharacterized protein G2W53_035210 [Senna tora]|uniref:Uncharacterized protein n=1 Tax=Senna tora TaxID=362788 RepID=A0A834SRE1_9FABA|nr:uncharacterized protein G2W53_035210 [Senna tora]